MWPFKKKDTKLFYGQKVIVVNGFYRGQTGIVTGRYSDDDYDVTFENLTSRIIPSSCLEAF